MKKILFILFVVSNLLSFSQTDGEMIDKKIKVTLANEDYAEAARLKKNKEVHIAIKKALANEDYAEATRLKKTLNGNSNSVKEKKQTVVKSVASGLSPEFMNQVYLVYNNELMQLEKQTGEVKTQTSASPWHAKSTSYYFIKGVTSTIQIDSNSHFILKLGKGVDPSDMYKLIRIPAHKRKDGRYIPYYTASSASFAGTSSHKVENDNVAITFKKISSDNAYSIYEIIPSTSLSQGEYAFMYINKLFAFKI